MFKDIKREIIVSWLILSLFVIAALFKKNIEFLFYSTSLVILIILVMLTDKKFHYSQMALWGLNSWLALHLLGGMASINGTRLYDYVLINIVGEPYNILKFDQVIHTYCYFIAAFFVYSIVKSFAKEDSNWGIVAFIVVVSSIGIGGVNEIIEFAAVVLFNSSGVGGYHNTAIDLVANTLGALLALPFLKKIDDKKSIR